MITYTPPGGGVAVEVDPVAGTAAATAQATADDHIADATAAHALSAISGTGTAAALNVGTGASQIVQLNGSAQLPAVSGALLTNLPAPANAVILAADTWDLDTPLGTDSGRQGYVAAGWALVGDGATDADLWTVLEPSVVLSYLTRAVPAQITETTSWEMRVKVSLPASGGTPDFFYIDLPGWSRALYIRAFGSAADGTALTYFSSGAVSVDMADGSVFEVDTPITITFRREITTGSEGTLTVYVGGRVGAILPWRKLAANAGLAGEVRIGHMYVSSGTGLKVHRFAVRAGINTQPVAIGLATGGW